MRIAITGSQGVGKTTLAQMFVKKSPQFKLLPEAARLAVEAGFKLDKKASLETELWLIGKQIELEQTGGDKWVADRCFIDLVAYIQYLFWRNDKVMDIVWRLATKRFRMYDLVIYLPAGEFDIEDDGVRLVDKRFQRGIDILIQEILKKRRIKHYKITGNPKERLVKVQELVKQYGN